jgi:hypothetical protein
VEWGRVRDSRGIWLIQGVLLGYLVLAWLGRYRSQCECECCGVFPFGDVVHSTEPAVGTGAVVAVGQWPFRAGVGRGDEATGRRGDEAKRRLTGWDRWLSASSSSQPKLSLDLPVRKLLHCRMPQLPRSGTPTNMRRNDPSHDSTST